MLPHRNMPQIVLSSTTATYFPPFLHQSRRNRYRLYRPVSYRPQGIHPLLAFFLVHFHASILLFLSIYSPPLIRELSCTSWSEVQSDCVVQLRSRHFADIRRRGGFDCYDEHSLMEEKDWRKKRGLSRMHTSVSMPYVFASLNKV